MKRLIRWTIILGILGLIGWGITGPAATYFKERNRVIYREAEVTKGDIVAVVNSTGTVKPVLSVLDRLVRLRADRVDLRRFQRRGEEGRAAGQDRPADLQGDRGPRPGHAGDARGRRGARRGPACSRPSTTRARSQGPAGREQELHLRRRDGPVQVQPHVAGGRSSASPRRRSTRPRPTSTTPRPTSTTPRSARRWTASSSTARSTRARRWPPSSRRPSCSSSPRTCGRRCTSSPRSTRPTSA